MRSSAARSLGRASNASLLLEDVADAGTVGKQQSRTEAARAAYAAGLKRCADCIPLWRAAAKLEETLGNVGRARALLEQVCG